MPSVVERDMGQKQPHHPFTSARGVHTHAAALESGSRALCGRAHASVPDLACELVWWSCPGSCVLLWLCARVRPLVG